jgi:hypothetical protein
MLSEIIAANPGIARNVLDFLAHPGLSHATSATSQFSGALAVWRLHLDRPPERQSARRFFATQVGSNPRPAAKHQGLYHSAIKIMSVYKLPGL